MTEAQALEAIYKTFTDAWAASHATDCPIALEGESFQALAQWVRFSVVFDDRAQRSMGGAGNRRVGMTGNVAVQVFCDVNAGVLARATLCDDVRSALELKSIAVAGSNEPVRVFAGASRNPATDGRWMMQLVVLPFDAMTTA